MSLSVSAGLSLGEFYECELWEISVIVNGFLKRDSAIYKNGWEQTRQIMTSMVGSKEAKKIVFPWDEDGGGRREMTQELWETTRRNFKIWEENYKKEIGSN